MKTYFYKDLNLTLQLSSRTNINFYEWRNEFWKNMHGDFHHYKISSFGRVKCKPRWVEASNRGLILRPEQIMNPFTDKTGYLRVSLRPTLCKSKKFNCHRLVGEYFLYNSITDNRIINHRNGVKFHNHFSNLEWVTYKENSCHYMAVMVTKKSSKYVGVIFDKSQMRYKVRFIDKYGVNRSKNFINEDEAGMFYAEMLTISGIESKYKINTHVA